MKRLRVAALSLALGSCVVTQQVCHSQNQTPGTTVTYQITPNVYTCGNQGASAINCSGIPFNLNGTPAGSMWLYGSPSGPSGPYGWGFFQSPAPMAGPEFTMNQWSFSPTQVSLHNGYPYGLTSFPCEYHTVMAYQNGGYVQETLPNCSTFTGTIKGQTSTGVPYTAVVNVDFWYYRGYGVRVSVENAIVVGGTVSVTYD